jgi:hypothetical protein
LSSPHFIAFAHVSRAYGAVVGKTRAYEVLFCSRARHFTALVCKSVTKNDKKLQIVTKSYNFLEKSNKMLQGK